MAKVKKPKIWATRLRQARLQRQLSLRSVAAVIGIPLSSYQKIEVGLSDPLLSVARRIAAFFDADLADLWQSPTPQNNGR